MAGYIGSKASVVSSGVENKKVITATAGQTSFTGLTYSPNRVHVFQNGVRLVDGTDYTATNGNSLTLTVGASANDQVVVVSYSGFTVGDVVPASTGGTFTGDVNFTGAFTSQGIDDNATSTAMTLDANGDISFYEDTGTTAKFFWDASAESLGIGGGVYSGTQALNLKGEGLAIKNDRNGNNNNWSSIRNTSTSDQSNLSFATGSGEVVIDHSGNLTVASGTNNAPTKVVIENTDTSIETGQEVNNLEFYTNDASTSGTGVTSKISQVAYNPGNQYDLAFSTYNLSLSERMRITTTGVLVVGNTSSNSQSGTVDAKGYKGNAGVSGAKGNVFNVYWTGSSPQLWIDTTNVGTISVSSDYRIKRNVETQTDEALSRVMQLRPVTYQMADYEDLFNASDDIKEGFIAHEVSEIIPSAVEGEKDCSDQIQSLKLDAIVSVLTKAIQEQQVLIETLRADLAALQEALTKIDALETRLAALEAN